MASTNKMIQNATAKNLTTTGKPSMQQYIKQIADEGNWTVKHTKIIIVSATACPPRCPPHL